MALLAVDSSTIISSAVNCLLWVFDELKKRGVRFIVPASVKGEVIDSGLRSARYRYEAIRVLHHFVNQTFEIRDVKDKKKAAEVLDLANSMFWANGSPVRILQVADAEVAVLAKEAGADGFLTDEKTLRLLLENPGSLHEILEHKLHTRIEPDQTSIKRFGQALGKIPVLRSVDLMAFAYRDGIFDPTVARCRQAGLKHKELVQGLLFALKFSGCAVSFREIKGYTKLLTRK